jgi:hypothetical protein
MVGENVWKFEIEISDVRIGLFRKKHWKVRRTIAEIDQIDPVTDITAAPLVSLRLVEV